MAEPTAADPEGPSLWGFPWELQFGLRTRIWAVMDQEIITPKSTPKADTHAFGPVASFLAAAGATMMAFSLLGAAAAASIWAFAKLLGLPDWLLLGALALSMVPVVWATVWIGLRAWHVEQRLAGNMDVDTPVFKVGYYLKKAR
jgi:hypothetical protein